MSDKEGDMGSDSALSQASDRFPFVMVLTTNFLLGAVFILFNAPLVVLASRTSGKKFASLSDVFSSPDGVIPLWKNHIISGQGFSAGVSFLILSLIVGLVLVPVDRGVNTATAWVLKRIRRFSMEDTFSATAFKDKKYHEFLKKLMANRYAKVHWEWELFNFYISCGMFTNSLIFFAFNIYLEYPSYPSLPVAFSWAICFISASLFAVLAIQRNWLMARVHAMYQKDMPST